MGRCLVACNHYNQPSPQVALRSSWQRIWTQTPCPCGSRCAQWVLLRFASLISEWEFPPLFWVVDQRQLDGHLASWV